MIYFTIFNYPFVMNDVMIDVIIYWIMIYVMIYYHFINHYYYYDSIPYLVFSLYYNLKNVIVIKYQYFYYYFQIVIQMIYVNDHFILIFIIMYYLI